MSSFFDKIKMGKRWEFIKRHDLELSSGAIVKIAPDSYLRIFEMNGTGKGGIVEKKFSQATRKFEYKCLIQNKDANEINEFITNNYFT